jgi:hypothetical protein
MQDSMKVLLVAAVGYIVLELWFHIFEYFV